MPIRARPALAGLTLALALLAPAAAPAQQEKLSNERIYTTADFRLQGLPALKWMEDGQRYTYVQANAATRASDLVVEDARTGTKTVLVQGARLVPAGAREPIEIEDYTFSADASKLLIYTNSQPVWRQNTKGTYYVWDLRASTLRPVSAQPGWQQFAKLSPDGTRVGFVRDNDVYVVDLATGRETRLTRDGSETIINGTFDWVYEEELGLQDGWRWSPDGTRIAFWRLDQSPEMTMTLLNETSDVYPKATTYRYPKAGTPNALVKVGVADVSSGAVTWIDTGPETDQYIARMEWAASPTELVVQRMNRHQNRVDVLMADARTGRTRTLFTETDSAWVDIDDDLTWIRGGRQFLWSSERSGYNHLYVYDRDGSVARQITRGPWEISSVHGVDEAGGWVYFSAHEQGPLQTHLYRVKLDGTGFQRLTAEPGTHRATLQPGSPFFIDAASSMGTPPVILLRSTRDGRTVRSLVGNERTRETVARLSVSKPELMQIPGADGTPLNAYVMRPADFDPAKKYPVLMYVYGGPGSQTVVDSWGGARYLWHQMLTQRGYVVVAVDNRGTGGRGRDFKKTTYLNLGEKETADQIAAARWLGRQGWVDAARIGIWGWSYGGYMTAMAMTREGSPFKAGIAVAPVTDWKLYDTIYTERFMRTPQENPEGYRRSAPVHAAANLNGRLLIVHGTGDDNVHFQNSLQMADALQAAAKQFDFMPYPNRTHSISGGRTTYQLFTYLTDWIEKNL